MRLLRSLLIVMTLTVVLSGCLPSATSGLQVTVAENQAANVELDGEELGTTPFISKTIQPGQKTITISDASDPTKSYSTPVNLTPGTLTALDWKFGVGGQKGSGSILQLKKTSDVQPTISILTVPDGATITLSGFNPQKAPALLRSNPGTYQLTVEQTGYASYTREVVLNEGYGLEAFITLAKLEGKTTIPSATEQQSTGISAPATAFKLVKILPTGLLVNGREVLRVRETPSGSGKEIGFAEVGTEHQFIDETTEWVQLSIGGKNGWVAKQYTQR